MIGLDTAHGWRTRVLPRVVLWLPLAIFVGIIGAQLLGPVPFGLANNNDFSRMLEPLGLFPAAPFRNDPHFYFRYFVNDYVVAGPTYPPEVPSSEYLIAALAKSLSGVMLPAGTFQLRLMGLIHAAILTLALFIFLNALRTRAAWIRLVCAFLLIFVWTDLEYVQQFNSAYSDAGAVVALAVLFSLAVHSWLVAESRASALSFVFFGCFMLATKTQHETALPFLVTFCLVAGIRARRRFTRAVWLTAPVFLVGTAVSILLTTPADYRSSPAFTLVFYKLAVLSPDPKGVLRDFRMPEEEFLRYVGHYAYEPGLPMNDPEFRRRIRDLVTPSRLGLFFWRHPEIMTKVLLSDLRTWAPDINLSHSGYGHLRESDVKSGRHPFELMAWSEFRRRLFIVAPFHLVYLFLIVILMSLLCILSPRVGRWFPVWPVTLLWVFIAVSSFLFASLLAAVETARHLVFFQAATDLSIFSIALSALLGIENHWNSERLERSRRTQQRLASPSDGVVSL